MDNSFMNKVKPKIIVMDLDGTLLTDAKNVSEYSLSILEKCKALNIKICIATARSLRSSIKFIEIIKPDLMILNGGALAISKTNKILYKKYLSQKTTDGIIKECIKINSIGKIGVHTDKIVFVNYDDQYREFTDFSKPFKHKAIKITLRTNDKISLINIEEKFSESKLMDYSGEDFFTFAHKKAEKFEAIKTISKKEKTEISEIIAFGDDYNDIEMVKNCGIGIAMENGIVEIKNIAKYVCGNNNKDGIGKWIKKNVL